MVTIKMVLTISLILSTSHSVSGTFPVEKKTRGSAQSESGLSQPSPNYDSWVGWTLGSCLISDYSVFIGTVRELSGPDQQPTKSAGPKSLFYSRVRIKVDEWLYGEPQQSRPVLKLDHVPFITGPVINSESPESRWREVELRVGSQLLIAFDPKKTKSQEPLKEIDRYSLAVSNTGLIGTIRATLANHARYVKNPDEMLDAPKILDTQSNRVFAGYLMSYLRGKGEEHTDTAAIVLSQLIGNSHFPEEAWRLFEAPLIRAMSNNNYPVSEAARHQVTQVLVTSSCGDKAALAKITLRILVILSDSNDVNVKPFLTQSCREKIIKNYRDLILPGSVDKGQSAFESQLGLRSN
jgi:hypothetical protein